MNIKITGTGSSIPINIDKVIPKKGVFRVTGVSWVWDRVAGLPHNSIYVICSYQLVFHMLFIPCFYDVGYLGEPYIRPKVWKCVKNIKTNSQTMYNE